MRASYETNLSIRKANLFTITKETDRHRLVTYVATSMSTNKRRFSSKVVAVVVAVVVVVAVDVDGSLVQ